MRILPKCLSHGGDSASTSSFDTTQLNEALRAAHSQHRLREHKTRNQPDDRSAVAADEGTDRGKDSAAKPAEERLQVVVRPLSTSFSQSTKQLRECQWYWGAISAKTAERLLRERPRGTFLVRDSHSENSIFSISYSTEKGVYHSRVSRHNGRFCLGGPNALIRSDSLIDFVEQTVRSSNEADRLSILMHPSSTEPSAQPIQMLYPLSRRQMLPSLKYLCRVVIRHSIRDVGQVDNLPLPTKAKKFLKSPTYLLVC